MPGSFNGALGWMQTDDVFCTENDIAFHLVRV
jgi:hypothetical protein